MARARAPRRALCSGGLGGRVLQLVDAVVVRFVQDFEQHGFRMVPKGMRDLCPLGEKAVALSLRVGVERFVVVHVDDDDQVVREGFGHHFFDPIEEVGFDGVRRFLQAAFGGFPANGDAHVPKPQLGHHGEIFRVVGVAPGSLRGGFKGVAQVDPSPEPFVHREGGPAILGQEGRRGDEKEADNQGGFGHCHGTIIVGAGGARAITECGRPRRLMGSGQKSIFLSFSVGFVRHT